MNRGHSYGKGVAGTGGDESLQRRPRPVDGTQEPGFDGALPFRPRRGAVRGRACRVRIPRNGWRGVFHSKACSDRGS